MITAITVVRDFNSYDRYLKNNPNCNDWVFYAYDNNAENRAIPERYNSFLDQYDYGKDSWFVFCHEDFEPLENLTKRIRQLDLERSAIYSSIGCKRVGVAGFGMQRCYGRMKIGSKRDAKVIGAVGMAVDGKKEVETFDCCCLIVHSSLVRRYNMRFDANLYFDFYVEDFCATAKLRHKVRSYVIPFSACHHSDSVTVRFKQHLPYLKQKYPNDYFVGTCTYFGTFSWQKRLQDRILRFIRESRALKLLFAKKR